MTDTAIASMSGFRFFQNSLGTVLLIAASGLCLLNGCKEFQRIDGNGNRDSMVVCVSKFSGVKAENNFYVYICDSEESDVPACAVGEEGNSPCEKDDVPITVIGDSDLIDLIKLDRRGDDLIIFSREKLIPGKVKVGLSENSVEKVLPLVVRTKVGIERIEASDDVKVIVEGIDADHLQISASHRSEVTVRGEADNVHFEVHGEAEIDAMDLVTITATIGNFDEPLPETAGKRPTVNICALNGITFDVLSFVGENTICDGEDSKVAGKMDARLRRIDIQGCCGSSALDTFQSRIQVCESCFDLPVCQGAIDLPHAFCDAN